MTRINMIRKVVQQVLKTGYLSIETEQQLQRLFNAGCDLEDLDALAELQQAVTTGHVRRQARQIQDQCLAS